MHCSITGGRGRDPGERTGILTYMQIHRTHLKLLKRSTTGQLHGLLPTQRQSVTDVFRPNTNFIWFSETTEPQIQILLRICKSLRAHSHPGQQPKQGGGGLEDTHNH